MSDHSLRVTFWTAAVIMCAAFLLSIYFARMHASEYEIDGRSVKVGG
jgi:hypothetical protein